MAEIWLDDCQIAEVFLEGEVQMIEVYPDPRGGPWRLSLQQFQEAMMEASARLAEIEGRVLRD